MDLINKIKTQINKDLKEALNQARKVGRLNYGEIPSFVLEVPREETHGDFATNLAMLLAREAKMPPRQIAEIIQEFFSIERNWVREVKIAGPGFINFYLDHRWLYEVLGVVTGEDVEYGNSNFGRGKKVQVEFVSANPTGLLHMGNARGAALGDSLANILAAAGYEVAREFYINDAGNQIENFGRSLEARYLELLGQEVEFPEDGYHGEDITESVRLFIDKVGDKYLSVDSELRREMLIKYALGGKIEAIREVLSEFGVEYDVWFSEQSLHDEGAVESVLEELREQGYLYEKEGALWFRATAFGEEKDEVLVRQNGISTYFASDIAYHRNKYQRGFDQVINIWGADHIGHVSRLKGALKAIGYDPDRLEVLIMQLVRLYQGGEILRMSKRTGRYITLAELIEEVGRDAARFFFVMRSAGSHLDFDLDLAKQTSADNPVYYVQYGHARICSILREAEKRGWQLPAVKEVNPELLEDPAELDLLRMLTGLPEEVQKCAISKEPHRLAHFALELASCFHTFYNRCRVLGEEIELTKARLVLVNATRIVLRNTLTLLGVAAPESM